MKNRYTVGKYIVFSTNFYREKYCMLQFLSSINILFSAVNFTIKITSRNQFFGGEKT